MDATAIEGWKEYARTRTGDLGALVARDAVFESPVVHSPVVGRDAVVTYLAGAGAAFGGPGFAFTGEWRNDRGSVLEFRTEIDGIVINGVDIIDVADGDRLITRFKVMVRPFRAVELVRRLMADQLALAGHPRTPAPHGRPRQ